MFTTSLLRPYHRGDFVRSYGYVASEMVVDVYYNNKRRVYSAFIGDKFICAANSLEYLVHMLFQRAQSLADCVAFKE